jgi:O-antigen/teichoic acid export membrane protein
MMWYAVPRLLSGGAAFALVPLYTRVLEPSEFGLAALALAVGGILRLAVTPGIEGVYLRYGYRGRVDQRQVGTILRIHFVLAMAVLALLLAFARPVTSMLMPGAPHALYYWLLAAIGASTFSSPVRAAWRAQHQADKVAALSCTHSVLQVAGILTGLLVLNLGVISIIAGEVVAHALLLPVYMRPIRLAAGAGWDAQFARTVLPASFAVVPEALATWVLAGLDRVLLNRFRGPDDVGLYASAYAVGALVMWIALILNKEWQPLVFDFAPGSNGRGEIVQRLWADSLRMFVLIGSLVAVLSGVIAEHVLGPAYVSSAGIIPVVALVGIVRVPALFVGHACWAREKMRALTVANLLAIVVFVAVNVLLIPRWGPVGAAWAGVAGHGVIVAYVFAQQWNFFRFEKSLVMWLALFLAAWFVGASAGPLAVTGVAVVLVLLLAHQVYGFWGFIGGVRFDTIAQT